MAGLLANDGVRRVLRAFGYRRVLRTFGYAFLGLLIPGLLGWLNDLTEWARAEGQAPFPDAKSLAYLGVAAISAGFIALINGIGIFLENATGRAVLRTPTPRPDRGERGAVTLSQFLVFLVALILVVWLLRYLL